MISHADDAGGAGGKLRPKRRKRMNDKPPSLAKLVTDRINECAQGDGWQQQANASNFVDFTCGRLLEGWTWMVVRKGGVCESYFIKPPAK